MRGNPGVVVAINFWANACRESDRANTVVLGLSATYGWRGRSGDVRRDGGGRGRRGGGGGTRESRLRLVIKGQCRGSCGGVEWVLNFGSQHSSGELYSR